ncbi:MAG: GNAT family N-acetyltransferase [Kofleriaceae bacterium]|nr:GNAT family N-acetyltransferase [Kofleriaceae bacterium]
MRLRPFRAGDRDNLFELFSDPSVARYWSSPAWTERAQADMWLAGALDFSNPTMLQWVTADRETDELLGTVTLFGLRADQKRAEIGYSLHPDHWGRGIAREAVSRVLEFGFDDLGLRRFEADVDPRNDASIGLLTRLGFQREGMLRERWVVGGEVCDTAFFGLLARDLRR